MKSVRASVAWAAVVAAAALVPLYGEIRSTAVTHPEWARMLLRGMRMEDVLEPNAQASRVFSTLSWRESLSVPADKFFRQDGLEIRTENGARCVTAIKGRGEAMYRIGVTHRGPYLVRTRVQGATAVPPLIVQFTRLGQ